VVKKAISVKESRPHRTSGIPISVSIPRKAKERARLHVQNDAAPFSFSLLSSLLLHHFSLFLSLSFLGIGLRAQSFTENTECRRSRESYAAKFFEEGPEGREEWRQEYVCVLWRQAVRCLHSCRSSSCYAEGGWCAGFVISACAEITVRILSNSENRICY